MNRRGFLGGILALGAAPAIVRADSLMRIVPRGLIVDPYDALMAQRTSNMILTCEEIARQALKVLKRHLIFGESLEREYTESWAPPENAATIIIRRPSVYNKIDLPY